MEYGPTSTIYTREIKGFPTRCKYCITSDGHVFAKYRNTEFWELQQEDAISGYHRVILGGRPRLVHRLVATAFLPLTDGLNVVNHLDENKTNNSVENLEWTTQSGNMKYYYRNRTHKVRGSQRWCAKLTEEKVVVIKRRLAAGEIGTALAREFGVGNSRIYDIKNGKAWTHVKLTEDIL